MEPDSGRRMARSETGNPVAEYHQLQLGNRFGSGALGFRQAADRMSDGRKNHTRRRRGPHSLYVPQHGGGRDRPSGYRTGSSGRLRRLCPEEPGILQGRQSVDQCRADHGRSGLAERKAYPRRTLGRLRGRLAMGHRRLLARIAVIDQLPFQRRFVRSDRRQLLLFRAAADFRHHQRTRLRIRRLPEDRHGRRNPFPFRSDPDERRRRRRRSELPERIFLYQGQQQPDRRGGSLVAYDRLYLQTDRHGRRRIVHDPAGRRRHIGQGAHVRIQKRQGDFAGNRPGRYNADRL